jgi:hypothetical protein
MDGLGRGFGIGATIADGGVAPVGDVAGAAAAADVAAVPGLVDRVLTGRSSTWGRFGESVSGVINGRNLKLSNFECKT